MLANIQNIVLVVIVLLALSDLSTPLPTSEHEPTPEPTTRPPTTIPYNCGGRPTCRTGCSIATDTRGCRCCDCSQTPPPTTESEREPNHEPTREPTTQLLTTIPYNCGGQPTCRTGCTISRDSHGCRYCDCSQTTLTTTESEPEPTFEPTTQPPITVRPCGPQPTCRTGCTIARDSRGCRYCHCPPPTTEPVPEPTTTNTEHNA